MSKLTLHLSLAAVLVIGLPSALYAQTDEAPSIDNSDSRSALEQLEQAAQDGEEAVSAPTEEEAKEESNETFDTPHDSNGD